MRASQMGLQVTMGRMRLEVCPRLMRLRGHGRGTGLMALKGHGHGPGLMGLRGHRHGLGPKAERSRPGTRQDAAGRACLAGRRGYGGLMMRGSGGR
jgi:hypothetical protein